MSKDLNLKIELTFSDELTEAERNEITQNVLDQLVQDINSAGIVGDNIEAYTETIYVTNMENDVCLGFDIIKNESI